MVTVFTIKINYKSGHSETIEVKSFAFGGGRATWELYNQQQKILFIGVDDIESVYQIDRVEKK